jgi:predicted MPP superfamily phosphohydrolase
MKFSRTFIVFLFAALAGSAMAADNHASLSLDPGPLPFKFVAYGDMRMTDTSNHRDSDPDRRKAIIHAIAQQQPKFVLISGDLVLSGSNPADWAEYDKEMKPITDAGATVYPALGNHDVHGDLNTALANYFQRFSQLNQSRYYSVKAGNVLVVTMDSEQDAPKSPQRQWLDGILKNQITSEIEFVVFCLHHPPYTHFTMTMVGHEARHEEKALAAYLENKQKASHAKFLVIAGHNHNYERYEHNGVMYIVSGGGGATPYMPHRNPDDFFQGVGPTYHYCLVTMEPGKLNFEMYKLTETVGKFGWVKADNFALTVQ